MSRNHLRAWREARGLTLEAVAEMLGTDKTQVSKLERGERGLTDRWIERFATKVYRVQPPALLMPPPVGDKRPKPRIVGAAIIGEVNVEASAGAGALVEHEGEAYVWAFPEYWLRAEMDAAPADIKILTIRGDSGISDPPRPTDINPGDKVLVNVADRRPSPAGLFVFHDGLALIAKRLEYIARSDPPRVRVSSNNSAYAPYEFELSEEENPIRGRIIAKFQRVS